MGYNYKNKSYYRFYYTPLNLEVLRVLKENSELAFTKDEIFLRLDKDKLKGYKLSSVRNELLLKLHSFVKLGLVKKKQYYFIINKESTNEKK
jgi:hypothetical protein